MSRKRLPFAGLGLAALVAACLAPGCSLGEGTGGVSGVLNVPDCWSGSFDLKPDFFAAVPSSNETVGTSVDPSKTPGADALQLRVQNGGDFDSFSDGLAILVDDAGEVRGDPLSDGTTRPSLLGKNLVVALAVGVFPPGVPVAPVATPAIVHATLYLQQTCRTQNVVLYALDAVTLNPDGTCNRPDGGDPPLACGGVAEVSSNGGANATDGGLGTGADASTNVDASVAATDGGSSPAAPFSRASSPIGTSTINFASLFDANPDESNAAQRLTDATFDFYLADPREICPGGVGPPPRCRGHLTGSFKFYFERGRPAQPFP